MYHSLCVFFTICFAPSTFSILIGLEEGGQITYLLACFYGYDNINLDGLLGGFEKALFK